MIVFDDAIVRRPSAAFGSSIPGARLWLPDRPASFRHEDPMALKTVSAVRPIRIAFAAGVAGNAKEDQCVAAALVLHSPPLLEAEKVEEADGGVWVADAKHGMKEAHEPYLGGSVPFFTTGVTPSISTALAAALPTSPVGSAEAAFIQ